MERCLVARRALLHLQRGFGRQCQHECEPVCIRTCVRACMRARTAGRHLAARTAGAARLPTAHLQLVLQLHDRVVVHHLGSLVRVQHGSCGAQVQLRHLRERGQLAHGLHGCVLGVCVWSGAGNRPACLPGQAHCLLPATTLNRRMHARTHKRARAPAPLPCCPP